MGSDSLSILPPGTGMQEFVDAFRTVVGDKSVTGNIVIPDREKRIADLVGSGVDESQAAELFDLAVACIGPGRTYPADYVSVAQHIMRELGINPDGGDLESINFTISSHVVPPGGAVSNASLLFYMVLAPVFSPIMKIFRMMLNVDYLLQRLRAANFGEFERARDFIEKLYVFTQTKEIDEDYLSSFQSLVLSGDPSALEQAATLYDSM